MAVDARDILPFPQGDNSSDTFISGLHWNLTTLQHWNYTYYSNQTFSNGSRCYIIFEPYTPILLQNGTFLNNTSCYSPISPMGQRSRISIVFACLFALSILFTFINLRKHGKLFLPTEKRFRAVGRRWQWYWMLAVAALGIISSVTGVDVDRYYLPQLPFILSNLFWFLMIPATLALVWESVRHWGSWQEREMIDPNPFLLRQDDIRSRVEFYLPLVFYFTFWMNFFMVIPRSWTKIQLQRSPSQARQYAQPSATDIRFKIAAFFMFIGWLTIVYSLQHSIKHYKPRNRGSLNRAIGLIIFTPKKFLLTVPLSLVLVAYEAAIAFDFDISPLKLHTNVGYMYGLGWGTIVCIMLVYEVAGYLDPNEDRELIRQRRIRGAAIEAEMGITRKPHWWSRLHGENKQLSVRDRISRNVSEVGGGRATTLNIERSIEMGNMPVSKEQDPNRPVRGDLDAIRVASNLLFPASTTGESDLVKDSPDTDKNKNLGDGRSSETSQATKTTVSGQSNSTNSGLSVGAQPQKIRSMLDV